MALPTVPLPTATVEVAGQPVEVRGLSRAAVLRLQQMNGDLDEAEVFILAFGCNVPEDEIRAWRDNTPADVVEPVLEKIAELSGLGEGAQKSG